MLYGVCVFALFVCVVFARFACDVWRDGVWYVFCCLFVVVRVCCCLFCLSDVCKITMCCCMV